MNINEKIDYLFSKINWGASNLDAKSIEIMLYLSKLSDTKVWIGFAGSEGGEFNISDINAFLKKNGSDLSLEDFSENSDLLLQFYNLYF